MSTLFTKQEYNYAVISGICAAWGSLCAKLSGNFNGELSFNNLGELFIKCTFIGIMLASNAAVWTYYVKALQASNTTIVPTVISTASNYIFSAIAGFLIFKEQMSFLWCCGMLLVISGLALITQSSNSNIVVNNDSINKKDL